MKSGVNWGRNPPRHTQGNKRTEFRIMAYYLEENEKWVKGLSRYYSVTDIGDVFSHHYDSKTRRTYKRRALKNGSFGSIVQCSYNGRAVTINVAVAMFEAHVRPLADDEILMPINGDATDMHLENMMPKKNVPNAKKGRTATEYLLENVNTGELICYQGIDAAKEYGLNGASVRTLIAKATANGRDYFSLKNSVYRFLVNAA